MAMQQVTVKFPSQVMRDLDQIALHKKMDRADLVAEIVEKSLRRERAWAEFERKRKSPEWRKATKQLMEFRKRIKRVPEAELEADIQEAITAVRAQQRKQFSKREG